MIKIENKYIIDDPLSPYIREIDSWFYSIDDDKLSEFYNIPDYNDEFWKNVGEGFFVYHATPLKNLDNITKNGITPKSETRGINNRGTPAAVFTSDNQNDISNYGDVVLEINVSAMKKDGYTPTVSAEEPLQYAEYKDELASKLGFEDYNVGNEYYSEGIYASTIIFYGIIPPQYIKRLG